MDACKFKTISFRGELGKAVHKVKVWGKKHIMKEVCGDWIGGVTFSNSKGPETILGNMQGFKINGKKADSTQIL